MGIPAYLYRVTWGVINTTIYAPLGQSDLPLKVHNIVSFFEDIDDEDPNYGLHVASYLL